MKKSTSTKEPNISQITKTLMKSLAAEEQKLTDQLFEVRQKRHKLFMEEERPRLEKYIGKCYKVQNYDGRAVESYFQIEKVGEYGLEGLMLESHSDYAKVRSTSVSERQLKDQITKSQFEKQLSKTVSHISQICGVKIMIVNDRAKKK